MKYRKRPVLIDAMQFIDAFADYFVFKGDEFQITFPAYLDNNGKKVLRIETLEGVMTANIGDWIIRGVNGEYYPCKPEIFLKTYEQA